MVPARDQSVALTRLLTAVVLVGALILTAHGGVKDQRCELRVTLKSVSYVPNEKILASFVVTNPGPRMVTVAKPLLPSGWEVTYRAADHGAQAKNWEGGVLQGTTHSGVPPRYREKDYAQIPAGGAYVEEIDLSGYLRNQNPALAPGEYEVTFYYEHVPNEAERDIPLISYVLRSNAIRVLVSDQ